MRTAPISEHFRTHKQAHRYYSSYFKIKKRRQLCTGNFKSIYIKYHYSDAFSKALAVYKYELRYWSQLVRRKTIFIMAPRRKAARVRLVGNGWDPCAFNSVELWLLASGEALGGRLRRWRWPPFVARSALP